MRREKRPLTGECYCLIVKLYSGQSSSGHHYGRLPGSRSTGWDRAWTTVLPRFAAGSGKAQYFGRPTPHTKGAMGLQAEATPGRSGLDASAAASSRSGVATGLSAKRMPALTARRRSSDVSTVLIPRQRLAPSA